jgi:hypothetical protein
MWHCSLLWIAMWALVDAEAVTDSNVPRRGQLLSLSEAAIELQTEKGLETLTREEVTELRLAPLEPEKVAGQVAHWIRLSDGSTVLGAQAELTDATVTIKTVLGMTAIVPGKFVTAWRWSPQSAELDRQWQEILQGKFQEDIVIIRRANGRLDYSKGVVESIGDKLVKFTYEGTTLELPRERFDGVVLAADATGLPSARYDLQTVDGSQWKLEAIDVRGDEAVATTVSGVKLVMPASQLARLRFAVDKQVRLVDMEPLASRYEPYLGSELLAEQLGELFGPRVFRDQPLSVSDPRSLEGERRFDSGIALHSRSELSYRLAGEFRRFDAVAGLDPGSRVVSQVRLVVLGDDRELWTHDVVASEPPPALSVDVRGVNRLTIRVDYGPDSDVGDQLNLCQARLLK